MATQAVTTDSTISRAVVFAADRAQVFRRGEIRLEPGEHVVHVEGLWTKVDRDSLQVSLRKGGALTTMRAVQFTSTETVDDVRPQVAELNAKIAEKQAAIKKLEEDAELCTKAVAAYHAVQRKVIRKDVQGSSADGPTAPPTTHDPEKWLQMIRFITRGVREQTTKKAGIDAEADDIRAELHELNKTLRSYGSDHVKRTTKDVAELLLTVNAGESGPEPVDIVFELSYLVTGAKWSPTYDVRINNKAKTMQLVYNANVSNTTGEAWADVKLELSTAAATSKGSMPALRSWTISERTYHHQFELNDECLERGEVMRNMMPQQMMQQMMPAPAAAPSGPPPPRPREFTAATVASADVRSQGGSSTFRVAAPVSIKSDGQSVKVAVTVLDLPVHFRYSAVPKLDPSVYLKVRAVNTSDFDLLAGPANVFSDNQLVSNTRLDKVSPGEDFWTFLGTDDDITVKRVKEPHHTKSTAGGFLSAKKQVRSYVFNYVARNNKGTEEELVIWDQYPLPQDKRIVVEEKVPTSEATHTPCEHRPIGQPKADPVRASLLHKVNDDRFIEWFVQAPPGQETRFAFAFSLEYPDELKITV